MLPPDGKISEATYVSLESPIFADAVHSEAIITLNGGVVYLSLYGSPYPQLFLDDAVTRYRIWSGLGARYTLHLATDMAPTYEGEKIFDFD